MRGKRDREAQTKSVKDSKPLTSQCFLPFYLATRTQGTRESRFPRVLTYSSSEPTIGQLAALPAELCRGCLSGHAGRVFSVAAFLP
mgnify:CR=1 FL=1